MNDSYQGVNKPGRNASEQQKLEADLQHLFEHRICFNEFLGFKLHTLSSDNLKIEFSMRPELIGHFLYGRLHGGVISSVLDVSGGLAVMWGIAEKYSSESADEILQRFALLGTVDMRVDYLRPGIGEQFQATAHVVRLGKRIATTQMQLINNDDVLIATGTANYIVS